MLLDGRRSSCPRRGDKGQCWLQVYARLSKPAVRMMSHTCVGAAVSALACVGRAYLIPRASSHRARTRRHRRGQRSCPAARRFDRHVFFALGCLVWVRWWALWPRSSKIATLLSGQHAAAASQRRFVACSERAQGVRQRRRMGLSGTRRPHLCAGCISRWFQVGW